MAKDNLTLEGARCDIFIGAGAGKDLEAEIDNAKKSIWVVSPYLTLINKLADKQKKGVEVRVITSNDFQKDLKKGVSSLIEEVLVEKPAKETIPEYEPVIQPQVTYHPHPLAKAMSYLVILTLLAGGALALLGQYVWAGLALLGVVAFAWGKERLGKKSVETNTNNQPLIQPPQPSYKVAKYEQSPKLPYLKVFRKSNNKDDGDYIHSKMYVIDDKVAFLGSLNFTHYGTDTNHETCMKFTEPVVVAKIKQEIEDLYNSNRTEVTLDELKKLVERDTKLKKAR